MEIKVTVLNSLNITGNQNSKEIHNIYIDVLNSLNITGNQNVTITNVTM